MRPITVGGLPGTGTTTLCRLLAKRTGLAHVYAGAIFRAAAKERGLDLASFGALCEQDPSVDRALDDRQVEVLRGPPVILEGRLSGWLALTNQIPAHRVWITCALPERLRRLVEREGGEAAEQERLVLAREASERARYQRYYGVDPARVAYDQVLDSTAARPEALADAVLHAVDPKRFQD